jgi:hypothetical protein
MSAHSFIQPLRVLSVLFLQMGCIWLDIYFTYVCLSILVRCVQLSAWLQESFKLDARQTLLLAHDLSILLEEYGPFRDARTAGAVGVALRSLTAVRVPNHPLTRFALFFSAGRDLLSLW